MRDFSSLNLTVYTETITAEPATSMNISKKFLDVLQLSFEVKYMDEDIKIAKKRKKIKAIKEKMNVLYQNVMDVSRDSKFDDIVALSNAYYNIGLEYIPSTDTDDLNTATTHFSRCLELLKGKYFDRKTILTSIGALNESNSVHVRVSKNKCTHRFLNSALEIYLKYTLRDNCPDPIHIASLVGIKEKEFNPRIILETLHHTTLQDLGLQYLARSKDKHKFVIYMYRILNIRLTNMVADKTKFDEKCLDMAVTLFDLSRYFLANGRFAEARSHIAVGDYVICRFIVDRLEPAKKENKDSSHLYESYNYAFALSSKSWGSYGVSLLRFWKEKFSQNKENKSKIQDIVSKLEITSGELHLIFSSLDKELKRTTISFTETSILNFSDAKSIFKKTLMQLESAKKYFTVDTNIVIYAKITLKISDTYKYFADFEERRDNQIKLHKQRVKCLEDACKNFRTTIRSDRELQIYKRIWYEMVTSCSKIMDLMMEETYYDESFEETSMKAKQYVKIIAENINFYLNV
ncbi:KIF-binding protein-like [Temnothorax longispinosus]